MSDVHVLAIDLAKRSFQVCATDRGGAVLFNRTLSRTKLTQLMQAQPPCIVAIEACATSHHWGRFAQGLGHDMRLGCKRVAGTVQDLKFQGMSWSS